MNVIHHRVNAKGFLRILSQIKNTGILRINISGVIYRNLEGSIIPSTENTQFKKLVLITSIGAYAGFDIIEIKQITNEKILEIIRYGEDKEAYDSLYCIVATPSSDCELPGFLRCKVHDLPVIARGGKYYCIKCTKSITKNKTTVSERYRWY